MKIKKKNSPQVRSNHYLISNSITHDIFIPTYPGG